MSQVVTGVTAKLQDLLPGQVGVTWPTATVTALAKAADAAFKERVGQWVVSEEISLLAGTLVYDLDSKFIRITAVEYSSDGTNYDHYLIPATLDDLDRVSVEWRDDRGTEPEFFSLLSCPGIHRDEDTYDLGSQILIYAALSSVTSEKIRVVGYGLGEATDIVPDDILDSCHVPYCLALMEAADDLTVAGDYMAEFEAGCQAARGRYDNPYTESLAKDC